LPVPVKFEDPYVRMLQVTDFVSGMTDSYALNQFRRLKGLMRW
jgi:dGTPase